MPIQRNFGFGPKDGTTPLPCRAEIEAAPVPGVPALAAGPLDMGEARAQDFENLSGQVFMATLAEQTQRFKFFKLPRRTLARSIIGSANTSGVQAFNYYFVLAAESSEQAAALFPSLLGSAETSEAKIVGPIGTASRLWVPAPGEENGAFQLAWLYPNEYRLAYGEAITLVPGVSTHLVLTVPTAEAAAEVFARFSQIHSL